MKRLLLAGSAALALTLGASACGSVQPNAAVVNGTAIKARDLEADAAAVQRALAEPGVKLPIALPADGNSGLRAVLSFEILSLLLRTNPNAPIELDPAAVTTADGEWSQQFGAEEWAELPSDVRERLATARAVQAAAEAKAQADPTYVEQVNQLLAGTKVVVNARYGSWDATVGQVTALIPVTTDR